MRLAALARRDYTVPDAVAVTRGGAGTDADP